MPFPRHVVLSHFGFIYIYIYAEQNYDKTQLQHDFEIYFASLIG